MWARCFLLLMMIWTLATAVSMKRKEALRQKLELVKVKASPYWGPCSIHQPLDLFPFHWRRQSLFRDEWKLRGKTFREERGFCGSNKTVLLATGALDLFDGGNGPLGDLVQLSDVISALTHLGYRLTVWWQGKLPGPPLASYTHIIVDYLAWRKLWGEPGADLERRRMLVLDAYGTSSKGNRKTNGLFGGMRLPSLRQFLTFIPWPNPLNTYLGVAVPGSVRPPVSKERFGLVWGKEQRYFERPKVRNYLKMISSSIPLYATTH